MHIDNMPKLSIQKSIVFPVEVYNMCFDELGVVPLPYAHGDQAKIRAWDKLQTKHVVTHLDMVLCDSMLASMQEFVHGEQAAEVQELIDSGERPATAESAAQKHTTWVYLLERARWFLAYGMNAIEHDESVPMLLPTEFNVSSMGDVANNPFLVTEKLDA